MTKKPIIELDPVQQPLSREMTVYLSERDYQRFKVLADERGERGVAPLVRQLALKALDALEG